MSGLGNELGGNILKREKEVVLTIRHRPRGNLLFFLWGEFKILRSKKRRKKWG
jgi:hypothetical protein